MAGRAERAAAAAIAAALVLWAGAGDASALPAETASAAATATATAVTVLDGLEARFHVTPPDLEALGARLLGPFDVSPEGRTILALEFAAGGGRNLVAAEAALPLLAANDPEFETFSMLPGGALVAIRGGHLARLDRGRLVEEVELPGRGMGLAPGETAGHFFVFGGEGAAAAVVFEIFEGRRSLKLIEAPGPVGAVAEIGGRLYVAAGPTVFGTGAGEPLALVYRSPPATEGSAGAPITSLAGDPAARILYVATADGVTALRGGVAAGIAAGLGGCLLLRGGSLFIADPGRGLLVELPGVSRRLVEGGGK